MAVLERATNSAGERDALLGKRVTHRAEDA
jgi:hypothetical protein